MGDMGPWLGGQRGTQLRDPAVFTPSLPPRREEVQGGKLIDNVDAKDSGFSGDDGDNKRKALKGLYFRIASKSKF